MRLSIDKNFKTINTQLLNGSNISQLIDKINLIPDSILTGINPTGSAISTNGNYLYVANNNNYDIATQDSVTVIDINTNIPIKTIKDTSFNQPYTITINGNKAYITNSNSSTITIINTSTNTISGVITGFDGPSGMAINTKTNTGYVNNYGASLGLGSGNASSVIPVNLLNNTLGTPIKVGLAPAAIAITPDMNFVYTANYINGNLNQGTLSKIQTNNNTVIATIGPFSSGFSGPFAIKINSKGTKAYVTNFGSNNFAPIGNTLSVVDLNANTIIKNIELGIQPSGIDLFNDSLALVSNYNSLYAYVDASGNSHNLTYGMGTVNMINLDNNSVLNHVITVGQSPANITIYKNKAYVSNFTSNTISVINIL